MYKAHFLFSLCFWKQAMFKGAYPFCRKQSSQKITMHLYSAKPLREHQKGKTMLQEPERTTNAPPSFPQLGPQSPARHRAPLFPPK